MTEGPYPDEPGDRRSLERQRDARPSDEPSDLGADEDVRERALDRAPTPQTDRPKPPGPFSGEPLSMAPPSA